jgi:hypothetical protein
MTATALIPRYAAPLVALLAALGGGLPRAHAAELKVDLNKAGRPEAEVNQAGYVAWPIADAVSVSRAFEDVTVTFTRVGSVGTVLTTNWYKAGMAATYDAKLCSDGITVKEGNAGGQIEMRISGLSAGRHTLLTYHNTWDNPASNTFSPVDIFVNGVQVVDNLVPSNRVLQNVNAPVAYLELQAQEGVDTVVLFTAELASSASSKNVTLCGFEIDTPNSARQARLPIPVDGDEHVDADAEELTLTWTAAPSAVAHDVYFGIDGAAVTAATRASAEFHGGQAATTFPVSDLSSHLTYYWRIDEIDALGNLTKGNIWYFRTRQLAFRGAEGYGRFARGGRGGRVVEVTTLEDYLESAGEAPIPGSLRWAIERETGPRTIVFAVSGLITLKARIVVKDRYVTLAGQTAPGKGICLRGYTLGLSGAKDVVVRFLRSRPGNISGTTIDGMGMQGSDHSILDHCSISWSIDEAFSSRSAANITLSRTLISEALNAAGHQNYPPGTQHGYAASIGGLTGSFHHNLLAHCAGRNWSLAGGLDGAGRHTGWLDIRNNVVYNWKNRTTDGGAAEVNFVNNYYKPGPASEYFYALHAELENVAAFGPQLYYVAGNVMPGHFDESDPLAGVIGTPDTYGFDDFIVDTPFFESYVDTQSAGAAYKRVLSDVGCNEPRLDRHDHRVIRETLSGTYRFVGSVTGLPGLPDSQEDVGGWEDYPEVRRADDWDSDHDGLPNWWEETNGLDSASAAGDFSDANSDVDGDGFTNLDDYLAWMAQPHETCLRNRWLGVDLRRLARGYAGDAQFSVANAANGTVYLDRHHQSAWFLPEHGFTGLASFDFTVVDAAGSVMTRTVGVRVMAPRPPHFKCRHHHGRGECEFRGTRGERYHLQVADAHGGWRDLRVFEATGDLETIEPAAHAAGVQADGLRVVGED